MINKIIVELIDGKKTYSIAGFAAFSNIAQFFKENFPCTIPEWTNLFNMFAACGALILVFWRLFTKYKNRKKK